MTTVKVTPGAYTDVANTLDDAVRALRSHVHDASGSLAGTASMSGSDIHGRKWGSDYDKGARAMFRALTSMSGAMARVAAAVQLTGENHDAAEAASSGSAAASPKGTSSLGDSFSPPPSAIGGDGKAKPHGWELVAAVVESVWPTADVIRMGQAAAAWSSLGDGLRSVRSQYVTDAAAPLDAMKSSELPGLRDTVRQLSSQLTKLAEFCDSMQSFLIKMIATDVGAWAAVGAILATLAAAVAATSGAGLAFTPVTFGLSDLAAAGADAGEIATASGAVLAEGAALEALVATETAAVETAVLEASEALIAEIESIFETMVIEDPVLTQVGVLPWLGAGTGAAGLLAPIAPPTVPQMLVPDKPPARNDPIRIPYTLPSGEAEEAEGKSIGQKQPTKRDRTLVLYYKNDWDTNQNAEASKKAAQLDAFAAMGQLIATPVSLAARNVNQRAIYNRSHGLPAGTKHPNRDVDHIHELQLGGNAVDPGNLQLLDPSVNQSIGAQIASQIRRDGGVGTKYTRVIIIDPPQGMIVPSGDPNGPK
ncbi:hypothetical protein AX769_01080 [Frondihabitans sp. PAMC 28766]|uniref:hypothetical protein n=1 Tax=Frondihabitans sp. PAMC 28766 TaxID=1795630 RepID=UPI00078C7819|nr:hypothetical protein [Frondihabitans sp. PAMC 28766]AMM18988.1 hypothetical protein AX769_01080 [Frondihabitans sp. PAMC 28766]